MTAVLIIVGFLVGIAALLAVMSRLEPPEAGLSGRFRSPGAWRRATAGHGRRHPLHRGVRPRHL